MDAIIETKRIDLFDYVYNKYPQLRKYILFSSLFSNNELKKHIIKQYNPVLSFKELSEMADKSKARAKLDNLTNLIENELKQT